jgi:DNA-3-methyladenine glycosylase
MRLQRRMVVDSRLADGPAKLCQALGIDRSIDGRDLCATGAELYFESLPEVKGAGVTRGPRVGLNNVPEPWHSIPWRFRVKPDLVPSLFEEEST